MKASLKVEAIGYGTRQWFRLVQNILGDGGDTELAENMKLPSPYWVAQITGRDPKYKYRREFLKPKVDYKKANSAFSRWVYFYYILQSGCIYDVSQPISWKHTERYFCIVSDDGEIIKVTKDFIEQWLNDHSE